VTVPADEERVLYSSAKIALNFHEQVPGHVIVNQRAFKIAACGGFQICDYVPAIREYFEPSELLMAGEPLDWFEKVEDWLARPEDRAVMRHRASQRALQEHTYVNRVRQVMALVQPPVAASTAMRR